MRARGHDFFIFSVSFPCIQTRTRVCITSLIRPRTIKWVPIEAHHVLFTCGRRPTGHGAIPVVVVVGVVVGGELFSNLNHPVAKEGSHPILKS